MKKIVLTLVLILSIGILLAQKDTVHLKEIYQNQKNIVTERPPQAVYFLIGGSGPILSVNYDRRFQKRLNGAGFAVGLGFWGVSGASIFSIPVSLNYLFGRNSSFVELAGGATFISAKASDIFDNSTSTGSTLIYHINLGYRYQPSKGGFFFRGGISPIFFEGGYFTSYYIGFGHNF